MLNASSFTFGTYKINTTNSTIDFKYNVRFKCGISKTFTDRLILKDIPQDSWEKIPKPMLESTLQSLFGNLTYLDLEVNHQWCKSTKVEKLINDYIQKFITPYSLLILSLPHIK